MRSAAAWLLAFAGFATPALAQPGLLDIAVTTGAIESFSIDEPVSQFGEISFQGGLVLRSDYEHFGAFSGLTFAADGSFIAVADTGYWFTGRLIEEDGRLVGVGDTAMAPILDADGNEANEKILADAEGVRLDPATGDVLVSFEQRHRVSRFDTNDLGAALPQAVALPTLSGLMGNRGLEAIAVAPEGTPLGAAIVLFSEATNDGAGNIRGWVVGGPRAGVFAIRREGQFAVTDAAFSDNGDLFVLERLFSLSEGIAFRIVRISAADIRPGAVVDGPEILRDDNIFQIDNMEGIAVRDQADGSVLITILSDDNHNLLQRTLMLQFLWRESVPPEPRPRPEP